MSFLECNVTTNKNNDLIYSQPYNELFISKREDGGILVRTIEYRDGENQNAFNSSMFFFDKNEAEILYEWLSSHIDKDEIKRVYKMLDK